MSKQIPGKCLFPWQVGLINQIETEEWFFLAAQAQLPLAEVELPIFAVDPATPTHQPISPPNCHKSWNISSVDIYIVHVNFIWTFVYLAKVQQAY